MSNGPSFEKHANFNFQPSISPMKCGLPPNSKSEYNNRNCG